MLTPTPTSTPTPKEVADAGTRANVLPMFFLQMS